MAPLSNSAWLEDVSVQAGLRKILPFDSCQINQSQMHFYGMIEISFLQTFHFQSILASLCSRKWQISISFQLFCRQNLRKAVYGSLYYKAEQAEFCRTFSFLVGQKNICLLNLNRDGASAKHILITTIQSFQDKKRD